MMKNSNDEHGINILLVRSHQVTACKTKHHTYEEPFLISKRLQRPALPTFIFYLHFVKLLKKSVESGAIIENIDFAIIHLEVKNCYSKPTSLLSFTT